MAIIKLNRLLHGISGTIGDLTLSTPNHQIAKSTAPFTLASVGAQLGPGPDNIVSLRGVNYSAEGGGNWMGIDYVKMDLAGTGEQPKFTASTVSNGKLTLTWTGTGNLEWSATVVGPWTPISPAPTSPYSEDIALSQTSRFYRLKRP